MNLKKILGRYNWNLVIHLLDTGGYLGIATGLIVLGAYMVMGGS